MAKIDKLKDKFEKIMKKVDSKPIDEMGTKELEKYLNDLLRLQDDCYTLKTDSRKDVNNVSLETLTQIFEEVTALTGEMESPLTSLNDELAIKLGQMDELTTRINEKKVVIDVITGKMDIYSAMLEDDAKELNNAKLTDEARTILMESQNVETNRLKELSDQREEHIAVCRQLNNEYLELRDGIKAKPVVKEETPVEVEAVVEEVVPETVVEEVTPEIPNEEFVPPLEEPVESIPVVGEEFVPPLEEPVESVPAVGEEFVPPLEEPVESIPVVGEEFPVVDTPEVEVADVVVEPEIDTVLPEGIVDINPVQTPVELNAEEALSIEPAETQLDLQMEDVPEETIPQAVMDESFWEPNFDITQVAGPAEEVPEATVQEVVDVVNNVPAIEAAPVVETPVEVPTTEEDAVLEEDMQSFDWEKAFNDMTAEGDLTL